MGKRSGSGITNSGTPGGEFPTKLPDLQGVSEKQIQFGENRRDTYKQVTENFDSIYENIRPIMMQNNVTFDEALDEYIGIDKSQGVTVAQQKIKSQYQAQTDLAVSAAKAGYTTSSQSPELQAKISQAKIQYKDQLVGKNKDRLPARINQRVVLDYTIQTLKETLKNETSASEWINLGNIS